MTDEPGQHLARGQVGTVVERLGDDFFEVEFSDDVGRTHAPQALCAEPLRVLHDRPEKAA